MDSLPSPEAILFDHDGTLVDSEPIHCAMWIDILASLGARMNEAQYREHYAGIPTSINSQDMVRRFNLPLTAADLMRLKTVRLDLYLESHAFPLLAHARETVIHFQQQGLPVAVVTGADGAAIAATLRTHFADVGFQAVVSGDCVLHSKPAPDCYLLAASWLGLSPQRCLAIEDTETGLRAATAAGMPCIAVPGPMSQHHDFSDAVYVADGMRGAREWILTRYFPS